MNDFDKKKKEILINEIVKKMKELSSDERMEIFSNFCICCGSDDPLCICGF